MGRARDRALFIHWHTQQLNLPFKASSASVISSNRHFVRKRDVQVSGSTNKVAINDLYIR